MFKLWDCRKCGPKSDQSIKQTWSKFKWNYDKLSIYASDRRIVGGHILNNTITYLHNSKGKILSARSMIVLYFQKVGFFVNQNRVLFFSLCALDSLFLESLPDIIFGKILLVGMDKVSLWVSLYFLNAL